jgi:hypothetical protein
MGSGISTKMEEMKERDVDKIKEMAHDILTSLRTRFVLHLRQKAREMKEFERTKGDQASLVQFDESKPFFAWTYIARTIDGLQYSVIHLDDSVLDQFPFVAEFEALSKSHDNRPRLSCDLIAVPDSISSKTLLVFPVELKTKKKMDREMEEKMETNQDRLLARNESARVRQEHQLLKQGASGTITGLRVFQYILMVLCLLVVIAYIILKTTGNDQQVLRFLASKFNPK